MSLELRNRIYDELSRITLIDPHTHIDPHRPASETLADILGYHYYTELAHSAGLKREEIEDPGLTPHDMVRRLMQNLGPIDNTIQYSWLVEMAREFFGFQGDRLDGDNWEAVYDAASQKMAGPGWAEQVLRQSNLEAVFLTNDFDDPLEGFDTKVYIPCLRTDDLVFHLAKDAVRGRLERATNVSVSNTHDLRRAIRALFVHFRRNNAKACAISVPPDFSPAPVSEKRADVAIEALWREGIEASEAHHRAAAHWVFWTLAEHCDEFRLPFDLMIGVNRSVYPGGVFQGMDLYDSRVSLVQYRELFNAFPRVVFPVSVLASVTNQELASYAWIFPNVVTSGHWWYSNTPAFIEHDAAARLEAVPRTKQIAYYSDMYKLEFALPKFNMYKRILAKVLAERYIQDRGWSEERAIDLGRQVLRTNVEEIFRFHDEAPTYPEEPQLTRSVAYVGTQAEKDLPPTDELPAMREFTYWPQSTAEGDDGDYELSPAAGQSKQVPQPPEPAAHALLEDVEEVDLVEENFDLGSEEPPATPVDEFKLVDHGPAAEEEPITLDLVEETQSSESAEEFTVSDQDLVAEEEPLTLELEEEELGNFERDFQLEDEERRE